MKRKIRYDNMPCKTVLNPVKAASLPFRWSVNPYRGCQHGCSFCYARSTHAFLGVDTDDTFQNHIFIKENAAQLLREQLRKKAGTASGIAGLGPIAFGTATDPYQPIEASAKVTRQCLETIADYQAPIIITTRSPLILRDIELLKTIPVQSVNISINTLDLTIWRRFEPFTPSPQKRLETVLRLREAGITAGVFMAPVLPYITDGEDQLSELVQAFSAHRADFVMTSLLRLSTNEVKSWFFQTLSEHYPHLTGKYGAMYDRSAFAPPYYRDRVMHRMNALLSRYSLNGKEPFRSPNAPAAPLSTQELPEQPVQLSFSF